MLQLAVASLHHASCSSSLPRYFITLNAAARCCLAASRVMLQLAVVLLQLVILDDRLCVFSARFSFFFTFSFLPLPYEGCLLVPKSLLPLPNTLPA